MGGVMETFIFICTGLSSEAEIKFIKRFDTDNFTPLFVA